MKAPAPSRRFDWEDVRRRLRAAQERTEGRASAESERQRILQARAAALAKKPEAKEAPGDRLELVTFTLAHEDYGIESARVREVVPLRELTPLPRTPPFLLGIVNVRGRILPVLDLKRFFELPDHGLTDMNKLLVLAGEGRELGILADTVTGLMRIPAADLQPALPTLTGVRQQYLLGVTPERLTVLDAHKIVADPRLRLAAAAGP